MNGAENHNVSILYYFYVLIFIIRCSVIITISQLVLPFRHIFPTLELFTEVWVVTVLLGCNSVTGFLYFVHRVVF